MPHLAFPRPLGEFYLAHELRNKPRGRILVFHFLVERLLVAAQGLHRSIERLERRLIEAGADMTFIRLVAYRQHQRAKVLARSARLSVTDDYDLLLVHSLELEPLACSLARVVEPAARLAITPGNKSALCPACTSG
jgi:hypothetical protein